MLNATLSAIAALAVAVPLALPPSPAAAFHRAYGGGWHAAHYRSFAYRPHYRSFAYRAHYRAYRTYAYRPYYRTYAFWPYYRCNTSYGW
jgi:hypothetical protein